MKKSLLLILFPLAVVTLSGCVKYNGKNKDGSPKTSTTTTTTTEPSTTTTDPSTTSEPPVPPAPTGTVNVFFVLGPNGKYDNAAGDTYASKFLSNTKMINLDRGAALPDKSVVTSTVTGSTFSHWVDRATTETVTKAPDAEEAILIAVFEGGDGGNTPTPSSGLPTEGYGFLFETASGADPYYKVASYVGLWPEDSGMEDKDKWSQYKVADFQLVEGQKFCLYDFGSQAGWTIPLDDYSCEGSPSDIKWTEYISRVDTPLGALNTQSYYQVVKTFDAKNIYIKLKYGVDNLYLTYKA